MSTRSLTSDSLSSYSSRGYRHRSYSSSSDDSDDYRSDKKRARHDYFAKGKVVDRISELPDAIIRHILSLLPAEDAVRSEVLSKRFANLWTNVDSLEFDNSHQEFIDNTLFFHNRSNLRKFSLYHYEYSPRFEHMVDRWIRILFRSCTSVKFLNLQFDFACHYKLPRHMYSNSSLIKLNLLGCEFSSRGSIKWVSLQSLTMSDTSLPNFRITDIVSGCPSLEFLEFSNCYGFTKIGPINNKYLKKLVIRDYREKDATLEIVAPHLQSLVISGYMDNANCKVSSTNSLINCYLDVCVEYDDDHDNVRKDKAINMLTSLLRDVSHVRDVITIGEWGLQVLSLIEKDGLPFPMLESRVKCLKLDTKLMGAVMGGIKCLLRGLNCLEILCIAKGHDEYDRSWFRSENLCFESKDMESTDVNLNIKTVEISGFRVTDSLNGSEVLLLVRFLLKNAVFLEKVTLKLAQKFIGLYESFLERLLSFPRSSPRAVFDF